jgi:hypothetical protein
MKLAKSLLFATMLVGMSAHASRGAVDKNCANSPKSDALTGPSARVQLAKVDLVLGSTAAPAKKTVPQTTPKADR